MEKNQWDTFWDDDGNHDWWKTPAPEVLNLIGTLSPTTRPRVLDLGCGLGRHAIAFTRAGFDVTATDASQRAVAHLQAWAERLGLSIATHICDVLEQPLAPESFDVIISYNVIYHGTRKQMSNAIRNALQLLRPGGIFFFTCPTREDGKYGFGELVAPHTYAATKSMTPGDIHYFASRDDIDEMVGPNRVVSVQKDDGHWLNKGERQFFSNWQVLAEKDAPACG